MKFNRFLESCSLKTQPERLEVRYKAPTRKILSTFEESKLTARQIYDDARSQGKTIQLCLSGGIDSECMAEAFLAAGVPFEAVTLRFNSGWNDYDIVHAEKFCNQHSIPHRFIDLDILDFLENGHFLQFARTYRCNSYQICTHLWFLDQLEGYPVFGGQQFVPVYDPADLQQNGIGVHQNVKAIKSYGLPGDRHLAYDRYSQISGKSLVSHFFLATPELALSHLQLPVYSAMLEENLNSGDIELTYEKKCRWYQEAGFAAKPKFAKFTGFEKLKEHYAKIGGDEWYINELFRKPVEKEIPSLTSNVIVPQTTASLVSAAFANENIYAQVKISRRSAVLWAAAGALGFSILSFAPQTVWACLDDSMCPKGQQCLGNLPGYCG